METSIREMPVGRPSFAMEVLVPPFAFTVATYLAFRAGAQTEQVSTIVAAAVCCVTLFWRIMRWDTEGRPLNIVERTRYIDDAPAPKLRPIVASDDRPRLRVGRWSFTANEWRRIGRVLATGKLTREPLRDLQLDNGETMFTALNDKYGDIVAEFQHVGFVNEDNETTDKFYEWYAENGIALPGNVR